MFGFVCLEMCSMSFVLLIVDFFIAFLEDDAFTTMIQNGQREFVRENFQAMAMALVLVVLLSGRMSKRGAFSIALFLSKAPILSLLFEYMFVRNGIEDGWMDGWIGERGLERGRGEGKGTII